MIDVLLKRFGFYGAYAILAGGAVALAVGGSYLIDKLDEPRQIRRTRRSLAKRPVIRNAGRSRKWPKWRRDSETSWVSARRDISKLGYREYELAYKGITVGYWHGDLKSAQANWVWDNKIDEYDEPIPFSRRGEARGVRAAYSEYTDESGRKWASWKA